MGIVLAISTIAGSIAPYLAGLIYDTQGSYDLAFYDVSLLSLVAGIGILFARPSALAARPAVQEATTVPVVPHVP